MTISSGLPDQASGSVDLSSNSSATRRAFLLMSLGFVVTGCAQQSQRLSSLPAPAWPDLPIPEVPDYKSSDPKETSAPRGYQLPKGVLGRSEWSHGKAVPALMNRMLPIRYITVHHDGMTPFYGDDRASAADRLEFIRRAHRNKNWGDIGYHFVIDRGGRVWQARSLYYQGAHVKDYNEGNIGVMCLGNFEEQTPTMAQLSGLNLHLSQLMQAYNVPMKRLRTHQEWAATACPGRNLQKHLDVVRNNDQLG